MRCRSSQERHSFHYEGISKGPGPKASSLRRVVGQFAKLSYDTRWRTFKAFHQGSEERISRSESPVEDSAIRTLSVKILTVHVKLSALKRYCNPCLASRNCLPPGNHPGHGLQILTNAVPSLFTGRKFSGSTAHIFRHISCHLTCNTGFYF